MIQGGCGIGGKIRTREYFASALPLVKDYIHLGVLGKENNRERAHCALYNKLGSRGEDNGGNCIGRVT